ncbi:unnamed protein product [Porites lobata]|uniref:LamG-like jellyroll fold domain-containing protein n=1 Tax=Porites lobata TaxID=104759 RepID=A0ABN8MWY7_9CNID|nr:unnamed protein product [Porites lobata]
MPSLSRLSSLAENIKDLYDLYGNADGPPVPAALFPLNGLHGTRDISANKNPPGIAHDVHLAPGPYGHPQGSYQFYGSSTSYIEFPNNEGLDVRYSITVLAMVKRENDRGPIFHYARASGTHGFRFWIVEYYDSGSVYANSPSWTTKPHTHIDSNKWYYVGISYDYYSGVAKIWVNGTATSEVNAGIFELNTHYDVKMGAMDGLSKYFKGHICCLQVYNKALSEQEIIAEIFFRADSLPVPVALYPLNGRYGTKDISLNKNPPGIPSGVHLASGPDGDPQGSYQFSGISTSHIEIPNNGGLDISYSITVLLWVNRQNNEGPMFVYGRNGFRFWIVGSSVYANDQSWSVQPRSSPIASNVWYYVGITYNYSSGIAKVWVNGEADDTETVGSNRLYESHSNMRMAAKDDGDTRYLKGRICCLQVYNKSLTKLEIIAVQNRTFQEEDGLPVPAALYPLNGLHGTRDISANKNSPGIPSGVHLAPGPYGNPQGSYQFSGSSTSYIEIPNNGGLDTRYSITILAWVNRENNQGPIFNYNTQRPIEFHFWIWMGSGNAYASNPHWISTTHSPMAPYTWYYIGITYDYSSGIAQVWLNGEAKSKVTVSDPGSFEITTRSDVRMGALQNDHRYFKGRVCCLQVYNTALNEQEIIAMQNRTFWFWHRDQSIFGNVQSVVGARESNLVKTYKASTVVQCLLRCSRITECKSAAIEEISNSRSSTGYCQLYRALFKTSIGDGVYFQNKQYYNIKKKVV